MDLRERSRYGAAVLILSAASLVGCAHGSRQGGAADGDPKPEAQRAERSDAKSKEYATNAVSVVTAEDVDQSGAVRIEDALEGRVSGVQVLRLPGGGISVRIRGRGSFNGSTEPLYVVDGMPVHVQEGRGLNWLNPADVARIEVLKDAGATSMYGVRGANGVILITTRRGR